LHVATDGYSNAGTSRGTARPARDCWTYRSTRRMAQLRALARGTPANGC
jgi:hypothetical protein